MHMNHPEQTLEGKRRCIQCGAEMPANLADLCPKCLLKGALGAPSGPSQENTAVVEPPERPGGALNPGDQFAHYRIIRPLGGGGMGTVFDAEDLETGRRVALKVLSHFLDSPEGRERFLREGRLAASINHPNSVYVFGTEEICGTPVIAMELVAGGTLEERVRARGPMPTNEAVDAALQIIAGLEAAQRIGILHRDVKPSNCFIDAEGTVKIGDFGLSISTALRTEPALTTSGCFLGTPAFCSPEQLRGEELNVRSDIYSVGMTLFYLLTGRTPFETKNVVALIATVLEQPAPSPRKWQPGMPQGLARIVQRCLEKQPGERFRNYDELRQALEPFSSAAPVPANLVLRAAAGVIDILALSTLMVLVLSVLSIDVLQLLEQTARQPWKWLRFAAAGVSSTLLYYTLLEGFWGVTLGKAACRLRVAGPSKGAPGVPRALLRAVIYVLTPIVSFWLLFGSDWSSYIGAMGGVQFLPSVFYYGMLALLFATARRRNGYAGVHDLASGTRVICVLKTQLRPILRTEQAAPAGVEGCPRVGPYHVLATLEKCENESWLLGYDLRLLRRVWIHLVSPGTPPVPAHLRHLGRIGRLRWLSGRRSPEANWDAFEAASGMPFLQLALERPQPWSQVRFWLSDLARELSAAEKDGTLPHILELDRLWVTDEGRVKLFDFPAPGLGSGTAGSAASLPPHAGAGRIQTFLSAFACSALEGKEAGESSGKIALPLPLHARDLVGRLTSLSNAEAAARAVAPLLQRPPSVTRARRAAVFTACLVLPALSILAALFSFALIQKWEQRYPGLLQLNALLTDRWSRSIIGKQSSGPTDRQRAIYIASHYRPLITNPEAWSNTLAQVLIKGEARHFAERSVAEHPNPNAAEVQDAEKAIAPLLPTTTLPDIRRLPFFPVMVFAGAMVFYVSIPAILAAVLFRGGLILLIAGVAFVRWDGKRASRGRLLWRSAVAWSPVWVAFFLSAFYMQKPLTWGGALAFAVLSGVTILSLCLPGRGLPDRLAGTWPVPR
jgi:eukaryotic-like serine/threonine-protein kinase